MGGGVVSSDSKVLRTAAKPPNAGKGRRKGVPNRTTAVLKDAIMAAFDQVGGVEYLAGIAVTEPKAFCALLGRVLPTEVKADVDGSVTINIKRFSGD